MAADGSRSGGPLTAHLEIAAGDSVIEADITVPRQPVAPTQLLPILHLLADAIVDRAAEGLQVSCQKGCGACCRQIVPVSELEAHHLKALVDALPEPERSEVKARFDGAARRLKDAGLLDKVRDVVSVKGDERMELGMEYFHLGIPCPFLEDESCSIHADRPVICREYLVTSPAIHCANPTPETVRRVPTPVKLSSALYRSVNSGPGEARWMPLVLALSWAEKQPELPVRPAPQMLEEVLRALKRTSTPQRKGPDDGGPV